MIALCLGGAPSVWEDLHAVRQLLGDREHIVVVCNTTGYLFRGRIDAWATLHPERLADWREKRAAAGGNIDFRAIVHRAYPGLRAEVQPHSWYGSSGLFTAEAALKRLGATGAILCGVPMDSDAGHIARPGPWCDPEKYRRGFEAAKAEGANIRSMSGWTAGLFGAPDEDWISGRGSGPAPVMPRRWQMHVRFEQDFDYTPSAQPRVQIAYKAGWQGPVKAECGAQAIAAGKAVEVPTPPRVDPLDHDADGRKGGSLPRRRKGR